MLYIYTLYIYIINTNHVTNHSSTALAWGHLAPRRPRRGMYAVFDGHGGREVATFCEKHMPRELLTLAQQSQVAQNITGVDVMGGGGAVVGGYHCLLLFIIVYELCYESMIIYYIHIHVIYVLRWKSEGFIWLSYGFKFEFIIWDRSHEAPDIGELT